MAGRPRLTSATLGFVNCQILKSICQLASLKFFSSTLRNKMNQIETSLHQLCLWKKLIFKPRCSKMTLATSSVWCSSEALRGIFVFRNGWAGGAGRTAPHNGKAERHAVVPRQHGQDGAPYAYPQGRHFHGPFEKAMKHAMVAVQDRVVRCLASGE